MTLWDVVDEIKDEKAREFAANLPYQISMREATEDAMEFIVNFSKETGDFFSLSGTDLWVMALAYWFVKENGEAELCRLHPSEIKQVSIKLKAKTDDIKKVKKAPKGNGVTDWAEVDSNGEESDDDDIKDEEYEALLER